MILISARRAANFHTAGMECSERGNEEEAIENYNQALALDPKRGETLYNLGLIYKYRGDWLKSFEFNRRARQFQRNDEATLWNLAIAATALRDWKTTREVWRHLKIKIDDGEGPIVAYKGGSTPVRLNAEDKTGRAVEVVWAQRLSPVTAQLLNIPTGLTGFRYHDTVLHDGVPMGHRVNANGHERAVFNLLELFEPSSFGTFEATLQVESADTLNELAEACENADIAFEDWTATLRTLCKACSEGRPHEGHDQELKEPGPWSGSRRVGLAATSVDVLERVLKEWGASPGRRVSDLRCTLEASA